MSPQTRFRNRMNVVLQMVTALIVAVLLAQLWLFTVTVEAMENDSVSVTVAAASAVCSLAGCLSVWMLIRFFVATEQKGAGSR